MKTKEELRKYHREFMRKNRWKYKEAEKQWRLNHPNYSNIWNSQNRKKCVNYGNKWRIKNMNKVRKYQNYSNENYRLKNKVNQFTRNNFKLNNNCEICGDTNKIGFHHWRYRLPVQKRDFNTLCKYCHGVQHGRYKNE